VAVCAIMAWRQQACVKEAEARGSGTESSGLSTESWARRALSLSLSLPLSLSVTHTHTRTQAYTYTYKQHE